MNIRGIGHLKRKMKALPLWIALLYGNQQHWKERNIKHARGCATQPFHLAYEALHQMIHVSGKLHRIDISMMCVIFNSLSLCLKDLHSVYGSWIIFSF